MTGDAASPNVATGTSPKEILLWFFAHWKALLASTFAAAILAAGISLLIPRSYQASAILRSITVDDSGALLQGSLGNSFGGSVASSLLGGPRQADDASVTMALMQSPEFLKSFIARFNLANELLPGGSGGAPSPKREESIMGNLRNRIAINQRSDGLISLDLRWSDPVRAEQVERLFIAEVNRKKREQTLSRTKANLDYLEKRLQQETTAEMRVTTANLAGKQLASIMLSQGPGDYAVEVVAPPYASPFPVAPARKLMTIMGAVMGFVGATLFLLALQAWKKP